MGVREPRCLVCGAPLDKAAIFEHDPRMSEVCSYACAEVYFKSEEEEATNVDTDRA